MEVDDHKAVDESARSLPPSLPTARRVLFTPTLPLSLPPDSAPPSPRWAPPHSRRPSPSLLSLPLSLRPQAPPSMMEATAMEALPAATALLPQIRLLPHPSSGSNTLLP